MALITIAMVLGFGAVFWIRPGVPRETIFASFPAASRSVAMIRTFSPRKGTSDYWVSHELSTDEAWRTALPKIERDLRAAGFRQDRRYPARWTRASDLVNLEIPGDTRQFTSRHADARIFRRATGLESALLWIRERVALRGR